ncbi:MAG: hypothetical protein LAN36_02115 [Acidobacteriia bacterium]|nr:hypothetical protein [Terriglobia bacterium]
MTVNNCMTGVLLAACLTLAACGGGGGGGQGGQPSFVLSQSSVSFGSSEGSGLNPAPVNVNVTGSGGALAFTATSDSPWLTATPGSGSAPQTIQISATLGSLTSSTYTGHVTIAATGGQATPATITVTFVVALAPLNAPAWSQWGANPQHSGMVSTGGQSVAHLLADIVYDPFVKKEQAENVRELTVHYQVPLTDGNDVYMMTKTGTYNSCSPSGAWSGGASCGPNTWSTEQWNEARLTWMNGQIIQVWSFPSDWKPEPNGSGLIGWEPVFHAVDANGFIYVPGAGGTVWKVNKANGVAAAAAINPFAGMSVNAANTYVAGPLSADSSGNIYYNAIELDPTGGDPWKNDVKGAWLVKITSGDVASTISFAALVPGAPLGTATTCPGTFSGTVPWPPANVIGTTNTPPTVPCGSQRPGLNIAPAIAADGTIYTASRAHFDDMQAYVIAVKSDLSGAKWAASLQHLLNDGCGTIVPIGPTNSTPNACRVGATPGVDPTTNALGSGVILDQASSSPTALPDGSVIFGAMTNYNGSRGHLFKFDVNGSFSGAYDFGWDSTAAVYSHGGTYSIVIKDNNYPVGLYCSGGGSICQALPEGPYYITQLGPNLNIEWQFQNTNTQSCTRNSNGSVTCTANTNPNGFEWCINMPAVDANGLVYATSEDGNVYVLPQGHSGIFTTPAANLFLNLALGAAYTPLSIGADGKIYTQNDGHLFVVGN